MGLLSKIGKIKLTPFIHIIVWVMFLVSPIFVFPNRDNVNTIHYIRHVVTTLSLMSIFYLNYSLLIKKFMINGRWKHFLLYNLISISILCGINYAVHVETQPILEAERTERQNQERANIVKYMQEHNCGELEARIQADKIRRSKNKGSDMWGILYNFIAYICFIGTAIALLSMKRLYLNEQERKEAEQKKVEAELKNLKSQLNPHFLFNTLNNIYALIAISQDKSQEAVMELSKMLRYVLYDADTDLVPISKEVEFISNYVKLMKLRLSSKVDVQVNMQVDRNPSFPIAPLLFISMIENAFKHGVSSQQNSFIHFSIQLTEDNDIVCDLQNSYFPKDENQDKSGSGIGVENTKRRLELIYPNRHSYTYSVEGDTYVSKLIIKNK